MGPETAASAVTEQVFAVTSCNFTAPIATSGPLRNLEKVLLHSLHPDVFARTDHYQSVLPFCKPLTARSGSYLLLAGASAFTQYAFRALQWSLGFSLRPNPSACRPKAGDCGRKLKR